MLVFEKVPFFAAIPDDKYALLASLCTIKQMESGTVVFYEGDVGDTFYLVANGMGCDSFPFVCVSCVRTVCVVEGCDCVVCDVLRMCCGMSGVVSVSLVACVLCLYVCACGGVRVVVCVLVHCTVRVGGSVYVL